ncbi:trypsin-like peptidase domain-containing protein [Microbacterium sp. M28]|uniref:S1C family serine protease n=1 Tax=Microbacterium sp. M28 TaxID=2962064 RepID=UPI0021F4FB24|nr:trypsin-like peptidase domain-containing protein [Microbacterium sp. M28]UYO98141.1 trypsin-like peptidase domain-containing protein [Microbacterium sp. M28]
MNEENAPTAGSAPDAASSAAASSPAAPTGHEVPRTFASPAWTSSQPQATGQANGVVPPVAPHGAAFGHGAVPSDPTKPGAYPADQPTVPLGATAPVTADAAKERKSLGAGKVAAIIVAAALVGGAAGLGSSYLGSTMWQQPVSGTAQGPGTVTVNNPDDVNEATAVASKVLPSVVTISVQGTNEAGSGSGVILSEDGYVLTNAHVATLGGAVADPTIRVTTSDGHIYAATIVGTDPIYDLAVIKLTDAEGLTPIEFADSSEVNVGATAVAVGAPLGLANSVTTGIISSLNRSIEIASSALPDSAEQDSPEGEGEGEEGGPFQFDIPGLEQQQPASNGTISIAVLQTDAAINPGNSGGALVDGEGKLIGINVAIATASSSQESGSIGVGFAIPSNVAERIADELIEDGAATHGLLGASVSDAAGSEDAEIAGAYIAGVTDGGAAEKAGLREGDIVTEFNGAPISGASDLTAQVRAAAAGSTAKLTYVRDGETFEIEAELGELSL